MSGSGPEPTRESGGSPPGAPRGLWGRAFRPFFLGLALHGALMIPLWTSIWLGGWPPPSWLAPTSWHGHEMIFGFGAAAIAGFLLTASPVWSGGPAVVGRPLAALFGLWTLGRIGFLAADHVPTPLLALVDVAFLPVVAGLVARTLRGSGQVRNYAVVGIVGVLGLANAAMHAEALGWTEGLASRALRFAVEAVVVLLIVISGRITPVFTRNALRREGSTARVITRPALGRAVTGLAGAMALVRLATGSGAVTGMLAGLAGLGVWIALSGWLSGPVRRDPLLWSLHAGSAWLGGGLLLVGLSDLGAHVPSTAGLHALTAGAMGTSILAVITRVSLGHTGRPLVLPSGIVGCHVLVQVAALARVAAPFLEGDVHRALLIASALAWGLAFFGFVLRYAGILTRPRVDGLPG